MLWKGCSVMVINCQRCGEEFLSNGILKIDTLCRDCIWDGAIPNWHEDSKAPDILSMYGEHLRRAIDAGEKPVPADIFAENIRKQHRVAQIKRQEHLDSVERERLLMREIL